MARASRKLKRRGLLHVLLYETQRSRQWKQTTRKPRKNKEREREIEIFGRGGQSSALESIRTDRCWVENPRCTYTRTRHHTHKETLAARGEVIVLSSPRGSCSYTSLFPCLLLSLDDPRTLSCSLLSSPALVHPPHTSAVDADSNTCVYAAHVYDVQVYVHPMAMGCAGTSLQA